MSKPGTTVEASIAFVPAISAAVADARKISPKLSAGVAAIALYGVANLMAGFALPSMMQDIFAWQTHDACWWTVKNFKELPAPPDVLLLGSSLMCRVVNEGDATYLKHAINALSHYRSEHLEDALSATVTASATRPDHPRYTTASLAVGGMNASDIGTLVPPLLNDDKKPSAIVYGIGPRDLFDNSLESAADAPAFRLAEKLQALEPEAQANARPSREARFKFAINRILRFLSPVYRYQDELSLSFSRKTQAAVDCVLPAPGAFSLTPFTAVERAKLNLVAAEVEDVCWVKPDNLDHPDKFDFNNNYYMSYNPFRPALYRRQLFFLERFLKFSKEHHIKTILVKMPLRADNLKLMVPNFYSLYNQDVDRVALANGAVVVDASKTAKFTDDDFTDTVHLSGLGACKLIDGIAPIVSRNLPAPKK